MELFLFFFKFDLSAFLNFHTTEIYCIILTSCSERGSNAVHRICYWGGGGGGGGVVLGPKTDGGVPLAAESWTQKDRGKNEIWGLKDRIL